MKSPQLVSGGPPDLNQQIVAAVESSSDGFAIYDKDDILIYCNPVFGDLFGLNPHNLIGLSHNAILQHVFNLAHLMRLNDKTLSGWLETFSQGWRKDALRAYEINSVDGGSYLITEQLNNDGCVVCTSVDIAHKQQIEKQLVEKETQLQAILDYAPALISVKDLDGTILVANRKFEVLAYDGPQDYIGKNIYDILPKEHADHVWKKDLEAINTDSVIEIEEQHQHSDGSTHTYLTYKFPLKNPKGKTFAICAISTDISERKESENIILESEQQFRTLVEHAPEAIIILDADNGMLVDANKNAEELYGLSREGLFSSRPSHTSPRVQPDGESSRDKAARYIQQALDGKAPKFEWIHLNSEGDEIPCEIRLIRMPKDNCNWVRGSITNISDRKAIEKLLERQRRHLQFLAHHDPLTHLPNRRLLQIRLGEAIDKTKNSDHHFAVMLIDLDRFKMINDSLGHPIGDEFLIATSERLGELIRKSDTASRLGGDEFVVLLERVKHRDDVARKARQFLSELAKPIEISGHELHTTLSIGICMFPEDGVNAEALIKNADAAMYKAKEEGKNNFEFYEPNLDRKLQELLQLENSLRRALELQQFRLVFQPQLRFKDGACFGAEVLIRWIHPEQGLISPNQFIPLAEETGLINKIGEWTLLASCQQFQRWKAQGLELEKIAVNISARQFHQVDFIEQVTRIVEQTGISPDALQLELTESIVMEDADHTIAKLEQLSEFGISLALDDFGTGYSSLSYLKRFPIQKLKIDQSFVRDIATDVNDAAIVRSVIALADSMNLEVIAEGVETDNQLDFLKENGCNQIQGFLFSRPLFADEFELFIQSHHASLNPNKEH